jgi:hypothetical protein
MNANIIALVDSFELFSKKESGRPPDEWWTESKRPSFIAVLGELLNRSATLVRYRALIWFGYKFRALIKNEKNRFGQDDLILVSNFGTFCAWWERLAPHGREIPVEEWQDLLEEGWNLARTFLKEGFKNVEDDPRFKDYMSRFHQRCDDLAMTKYPAIGVRGFE